MESSNKGPTFKEGFCMFILKQKNKQCSQPIAKESKNYCRFHRDLDNQEEAKEVWVSCPYEPKYKLLESQLEAHLKNCPKLVHISHNQSKPWYTPQINIMNKQIKAPSSHTALKDVPFDIQDTLIEKVKDLYSKWKSMSEGTGLEQLFKVDEMLEKKLGLEQQQMKDDFFRHSDQQNKIVDIMIENNLISEHLKALYVEYGAGRAGLSSFVASKLKQLNFKDAGFLAVDRDTRRYKLDKEYNTIFMSFREKIDICDFDLKRYLAERKEQFGGERQVVMIAKHLCGGATDLTLASAGMIENLHGLAIATCCHHCCDQPTYVNLKFLKENFTDEEIELLPRVSSWSVSKKVKMNKMGVGFKAKRLFDLGRCLFLQEQLKLNVKVYQYCDPVEESPENILLTAWK